MVPVFIIENPTDAPDSSGIARFAAPSFSTLPNELRCACVHAHGKTYVKSQSRFPFFAVTVRLPGLQLRLL